MSVEDTLSRLLQATFDQRVPYPEELEKGTRCLDTEGTEFTIQRNWGYAVMGYTATGEVWLDAPNVRTEAQFFHALNIHLGIEPADPVIDLPAAFASAAALDASDPSAKDVGASVVLGPDDRFVYQVEAERKEGSLDVSRTERVNCAFPYDRKVIVTVKPENIVSLANLSHGMLLHSDQIVHLVSNPDDISGLLGDQ